jgi:hypothetical protein
MKRIPLYVCLVLLLVLTVLPAATASPLISGISPATVPNTGDFTLTITGSGFTGNSTVFLETPYAMQDALYGTVVSWSPTSITVRFSLSGKAPARYNVWVNTPFTDPYGNFRPQDLGELPLGFTISQGSGTPVTTTATPVAGNGMISVSSNPPGANVYVDNEYKGLTTLNIQNVQNGIHIVKIRSDGYQEWSREVVVYGNSQSLFATLVPIPTATTATTVPPTTTYPTPTATVPTTKSPSGIETGIIGVIGAALILIKRK